MDDNKSKALAAALSQIEKQYGKGSIMKMDDAAIKDIDVVSTGSLGLDLGLGVGGLPRGRVVEIYGPESSGKTTLTLQVIAEMQKIGGTAAFIDAENALDISYAAKLGVKTADLLISQPDTGEQALEIADMLVRSGAVDVIVVDSVAALTPKAEIEGEMGEPQMGLQARLMSQALRKLTANIKRTNTLVIFINQIRMKIGVMFGNPETTTGGNALKFYASVRIDIRRIGSIKKGDEVVGSETRVKIVKNKVAPPFRQAEFDILYGEGISREGEVLEIGVLHGVLEKSGAWYIYNGDRLGQGKDNSREFLKENPALAKEIEGKIREKAGVQKPAPVVARGGGRGGKQQSRETAHPQARIGHGHLVLQDAGRQRCSLGAVAADSETVLADVRGIGATGEHGGFRAARPKGKPRHGVLLAARMPPGGPVLRRAVRQAAERRNRAFGGKCPQLGNLFPRPKAPGRLVRR